ncbi:MAG TPA: winged helix-turn-helix transcriptional regulator, partial [Thermoplasmata archaeon]
MDDQDVRIFCEMAFREGSYNTLGDRQPSLSGIGRRLGLDEKTIRSRVRRMEKDGFIRYYQ